MVEVRLELDESERSLIDRERAAAGLVPVDWSRRDWAEQMKR